jgi:hypothetical protein
VVAYDGGDTMIVNGNAVPYSFKRMEYLSLDDDVIVWNDGIGTAMGMFKDTVKNGYREADRGERSYSILVSMQRIFYMLKLRPMPRRSITIQSVVNIVSTAKPREIMETFGGGSRLKSVWRMAAEFERLGIRGVTAGASAISIIRRNMGYGEFAKNFPWDEAWLSDVRMAYRGGIVWTDGTNEREYGEGVSYDNNSLYPYCLTHYPMPYGTPVHYEGEYEHDDGMPYHVERITFRADLKDGGIPFLSGMLFPWLQEGDYVTSTKGFVTMWLTDIDIISLTENYDVYILEHVEGYKFAAKMGMFSQYVSHWATLKASSHDAERKVAKLMINAPIGKFGAVPRDNRLDPSLDEDGEIQWNVRRNERRNPLCYPPVAMWTTALARSVLLKAMRDNRDRLIYADTDSVVLIGKEPPNGITVHPTKLGCWKIEREFTSARILGLRKYEMQTPDGVHMCLSGVSRETPIPYDMFHKGVRHNDDRGNEFVL